MRCAAFKSVLCVCEQGAYTDTTSGGALELQLHGASQ